MPGPLIDRKFFAGNFPSASLFGKKLTPSRRQGFDAIFDVWDGIEEKEMLAGLAYALATAWHETGGTMLPVREGFKSTDELAYKHVTAYCKAQGIPNYAARHPNGNSYYGRGYVQLTHGDNYKKVGKQLGLGDAFYDKPDDVLKPEVGGKILIVGMIDGLYRPAHGKLADYFGGSTRRWFDARDLINGDKNKKPKWAGGKKIGTLVADYGKGFFGALKSA
jgi:Chitinase class I